MEQFKSIAVPVTVKRGGASKAAEAAKARPDSHEQVGQRLRRHESPASMQAKLHRYQVGQRLRMVAGGRSWARPEGPCKVVALLPHETGPFLYRVRSETETFERVISEDDLLPATVL